MSWDTGLADRIRAKGVRVVEVDGWRTRGSTTYEPLLALWHHTAGSSSGAVPSLATCIYGRPDVPGPLSQVLQSREPDGQDDIAYVIAAGRANHGGTGSWRGISGNSRSFGLEVEHIGTTSQPARRHEITARILAAGLEGGSRDARNCCRHAEYATPPGRKIDFAVAAAPWTADGMRSRVSFWVGRTDQGDDEMTPEDREWMAELVRNELRRVLQFLTADEGNTLTGGQPWADDALTIRGLYDEYGRSGSKPRVAGQEMSRRGVNWSLGADASDASPNLLKARLDAIDANQAEILRLLTPDGGT